MNNVPLYNSTLLASYMDLIEENYPYVDVPNLLKEANISPFELADKGHWLTQEQVDLFYECLVRATGNSQIAREAGRYVVTSKSSSMIRQYAAGFVTPAVAYWMFEKISSTLSKHATFKIHYLASNKVEIITTAKANVDEKPYQCENRIGLFEALIKFFTDEYPHVDHPECIHKGGACCRYIISWKITSSIIWKLVSNYSALLGIILLSILSAFLPFRSWIICFLIASLLSTASLLVSQILANRDLRKSVRGQQDVGDQLMHQFNIRYNEISLIKEIGEAASGILDPHDLLIFITEALQKHLRFNRGMIMLANTERTKLVYTSGYGYPPYEEALLRNTNFNLTNPESKGVFYLAFHNQKPFLINSIQDVERDLSQRSSGFAKEFNVDAFICVPIIYEGKSEGVLAVDTTDEKSIPTQSDLSLLTGIAQQIGISLNNAISHKKLKESEERFRNLSNSSPDIIYQLDHEGRIKYVNPAWEEILGHEKKELEGRHLSYFLNKESHTEFNETIQSILQDKLRVRDKYFTILNSNGLRCHITMTGAPDYDSEGNVIGIVGTIKDISKLRGMEAQLLQASKMEAVGTLAGGIAHDFNNIIQAIMGYNELMISSRHGDEPDMRFLNNIGKLLTRSSELVRQLLLFSRKVEPIAKTININEEIKSIHSLLIKSISKMIEIKTDLSENIFPIKADANQIGQIIMNLVINARDAMGDSGIITIRTANMVLHEETMIDGLHINPGAYIQLSVLDAGCGMEPDLMKRVFEPFFTTKGPGKGTGLGLSVVHGIVKNHNGFIYCESEPDKGTTFHIILPASIAGVEPQKVKELTKPNTYGTEMILLVDDEKSILETVRDTLNLFGYRVETAENGEQALEAYSRLKDEIDLVILDLIMPGCGGKKCLDDLREINHNVKVLMTSGYSNKQQTEDLTLAGAAGFIHKPYRPEDLLSTIREIIDARNHSDDDRIPLHNNKGV
jgi:PAS domain S-box-containing protein